MAVFNFNDYQRVVAAAQNKESAGKVGWFKLANDGDEALVRFNISSTDDIQFATIHQLGASTNYMKISCLNDFTGRGNCPLCEAIAQGNTEVGKASKRVYIPMMVSYRDKTTGQWSAPQAAIWDRPAGFSREVANKLRDAGDLRNVLLKITRNGAKGDMKTTYSVDFAMPTIFKPEMIPVDFSAFNGFRLDKHSFWVKSADEIRTYFSTGEFPSVTSDRSDATSTTNPTNSQVAMAYTATQSVQPPQMTPQAQPQYIPQPQVQQPQMQPQTTADPTKKFSNFSF